MSNEKVMSLREAVIEFLREKDNPVPDATMIRLRLSDLRSALAAEEELHNEIVAVLRDVGTKWDCDRPIVVCRWCDGEGRKIAAIIHEPDCRLAALLAKLEGKVTT